MAKPGRIAMGHLALRPVLTISIAMVLGVRLLLPVREHLQWGTPGVCQGRAPTQRPAERACRKPGSGTMNWNLRTFRNFRTWNHGQTYKRHPMRPRNTDVPQLLGTPQQGNGQRVFWVGEVRQQPRPFKPATTSNSEAHGYTARHCARKQPSAIIALGTRWCELGLPPAQSRPRRAKPLSKKSKIDDRAASAPWQACLPPGVRQPVHGYSNQQEEAIGWGKRHKAASE